MTTTIIRADEKGQPRSPPGLNETNFFMLLNVFKRQSSMFTELKTARLVRRSDLVVEIALRNIYWDALLNAHR